MHRPEPSGSHEHPKSALNLRLVLAAFGLAMCTAFGVMAFLAAIPWLGAVLIFLAVVALIDLVVVGRRVIRRRRRGEHHTMFE